MRTRTIEIIVLSLLLFFIASAVIYMTFLNPWYVNFTKQQEILHSKEATLAILQKGKGVVAKTKQEATALEVQADENTAGNTEDTHETDILIVLQAVAENNDITELSAVFSELHEENDALKTINVQLEFSCSPQQLDDFLRGLKDSRGIAVSSAVLTRSGQKWNVKTQIAAAVR